MRRVSGLAILVCVTLLTNEQIRVNQTSGLIMAHEKTNKQSCPSTTPLDRLCPRCASTWQLSVPSDSAAALAGSQSG